MYRRHGTEQDAREKFDRQTKHPRTAGLVQTYEAGLAINEPKQRNRQRDNGDARSVRARQIGGE